MLQETHHDLHGWAGRNMADSTFAAFDPLFRSFHAIFDRFFEGWIRETGKDVQRSSRFPPRLPIEDCASSINLDVGLVYGLTTLGGMVSNTKSLGYLYGIPVNWSDRSERCSETSRNDANGQRV